MTMKYRWAWVLVAALPATALSASPFSEMAQGLRERGYYDYALLYLDQLASKSDLPAEVRQEIPYEKAMVLLENSRAVRSPEKQAELLDQAQAYLEQFAVESPNHPRAGEANSQRAEILLGRARVEILQSRLPANQGTRSEFQERARKLIAQARQVFETAKTQHEAKWQSYGTYVDPDKEPEKYEAREQALMQLIAAMLNVCQCRYEEAQTHDSSTPEFKRLLNQAAEEFEQLYQRYRNYTGGLYARLYEAKCFDDQGDVQKAMGIYNELLGHEGSNRNLRKLQNLTLQFKLEALNRKTPPDSQLVIDFANEWLKENQGDVRSQVGLGIQWQQALAYEALGDQRELVKSEKERYWRAARTAAQAINRFPSIYRDVSLAMIQRLDGKLGGRDRKPEDFDAAFGLAKQHFMTIQELRKELEGAKSQGKPAEETKKLEQDLSQEMHDAAQLFELAINLADKNDEPKSVATARLWLAYVHYWARRNYEAAILGEYVARTAPKDESSLAMDAAYLAMAAFVQAYNDAKGSVDQKSADLSFIIKACEVISSRWPESDRANDARMTAGRMYSLAKQPVDAAAWFSKVPEADSRYADAQLAAGQAYWRGYLSAARLPVEQRPPADQLQEWQTRAQQHLRTGLARMSATIPTEGTTPIDLVSAKVSLSEILVSAGQEGEAISLLTADPHSVVKAIAAPEESQRPETGGVKSRTFAVEVYKLLLRAYIGNGKLDEARATMKTLEGIAGGGPAGADITELYVGLGRLLRDELERIKNSGNIDRFNSLRASFETFLNDLYQRQEGHSIGTLSWVGETYAALGESEPAGSLEATMRFEKAAEAFRKIVQEHASSATPGQLLAVKTRLAHCLRMKKDFSAAESLVNELLRQKKDDLNLQIEGALLYEDWAAEPGQEKKYLTAISGNKESGLLGFGPLSKRIHGLMRGGKRSELLESYLETRYHTSLARLKYALAQKSSKDKRHELDNAELEIVAFATVTKDVPDEWREKFNDLFRQVRVELADSKRPVKDLEFAEDVAVDAPPEIAEKATEEKQPRHEKKGKEPKPKVEPTNPALTYGLVGLGTAVGIALAALIVLRGKKRHQPLLKSQADRPVSFDFGEIPAPRVKGATAFPVAAKTSATRAAKPATAKPKPKPPSAS